MNAKIILRFKKLLQPTIHQNLNASKNAKAQLKNKIQIGIMYPHPFYLYINFSTMDNKYYAEY